MNITETSADGLKREYKVVISAQDIEQKVQGRLEELRRTVQLPGFRPGKVPVAVIKQRYGGSVLADFPQPETPDGPEIFAQAAINTESAGFTEIKAYIINKSAWPARHYTGGALRYYFTLDGTTTPDQLKMSSPYNQCDPPGSPKQYQGNVYYVEITCSTTDVAPSGQSDYRKEIQFRITSAGTWDPSNDWSYQGLPSAGSTPVDTNHLVLIQDGRAIWGTPPS